MVKVIFRFPKFEAGLPHPPAPLHVPNRILAPQGDPLVHASASAGIAPPLSRAQLGELRTARAQAARVGATAGRAGVAEAAEAAEEAAEAAAEEEELLLGCI